MPNIGAFLPSGLKLHLILFATWEMRISQFIFTAAVLTVTSLTDKNDWRLVALEHALFTLYMGCSLITNYVLQRIVEKKRDLSVIQLADGVSTQSVTSSVEDYDLSILFRSRIMIVVNGILISFVLFKFHIPAAVILLSSFGLFRLLEDPLV